MRRTLVELIAGPGSLPDLTNLFSAMAEAVIKIGVATSYTGGSFLDGREAAKAVQDICKCVHKVCPLGSTAPPVK